MAPDFDSNADGHPNDFVRDRSGRAAAVASGGARLVPRHTVHKQSLSDRMLHNRNAFKRRLNQNEILSYGGPKANVNPLHTNNARPGTDGNWFNRRVQNNLNRSINQPSALGSEPVQQLRYLSDSIPTPFATSILNGLQGYQSLFVRGGRNAPYASFGDLGHQHLNRNQSFTGRIVNQYGRPFFGNNVTGANNLILPPFNNQTIMLNHRIPLNKWQPATVPNLSVKVGPTMQNLQGQQIKHHTPSAITTSVYPISHPGTAALPTRSPPTTERAFRNLPVNSFPTASRTSPSGHSPVLPVSSTTKTSASPSNNGTVLPVPTVEDLNNVPGLYEKVGISKKVWRCTYKGCGRITNGTRDRTRHVGKHARQEEKLIEKGRLKLKDAIALHRAKLLTYECKEQDCGYLITTGKPYYVKDYRVDCYRDLHIKNYHSNKVIPG